MIKRLHLLLILCTLSVLFTGFMYAGDGKEQYKFSIAGGGSLPVDKFAGTDIEKFGYAKRGYAFRIETYGGQSKVMRLTGGIVFASHPFDTPAREKDLLKLTGADFTVSADNYKSLWFLGGITIAPEDVPLFVTAQAGAVSVSFPDIKQSLTSGYNTIVNSPEISLGFCGGAGFQMHNFDVSLRYYYTQPQITRTIPNSTVKPYAYKTVIAFVTATLGFSF